MAESRPKGPYQVVLPGESLFSSGSAGSTLGQADRLLQPGRFITRL